MLHHAKIAVVIPAFNEARLITSVLQNIPTYVDTIVVVDDGSDDSTSARALTASDNRVLIAQHKQNLGVGAAIATGYRLALEQGADVTAVMAADGQMDPDDLESLLNPILQGEADYTKGDRLSHPHVRRQMPFSRWLGNHLLTVFTRYVTGLVICDSQCGYTAISRSALEALPLSMLWRGYGYPNDVLGWLSFFGFRIKDVVVRPIYGEEESGVGLRHALFVVPFVLTRIVLRRLLWLFQRRLGGETLDIASD